MGKKVLLIILSSLFLLTGCYDANEPNDIAYVVALGVDSSEDENIYEFTIQFAKTTQISGGSSEEGGKEGSNILEIINVKAPTVYSGINIANQVVSKRFTLAHTKLIVISDEIAKKGVKDLFDTFGRNSDIRPNIYMSVSNGKAKDYLENVKPVAEVNPVTYYRLIYESEYGGYVPKTILKDFYFQLDGIDKQNVLPLAGVNEKNKQEAEKEKSSGGGESGGQEKNSGSQSQNEEGGQENEENQNTKKVEVNKKGFDFLLKDYSAGNIDVDKKNASEVMGMAVFRADKMVGTMDSIESLIYNMLRGSFELSYISFYNEDVPDLPITIAVEQRKNPRISVKLEEEPKIKVKVYLEGQLMSESVENPIEDDIKKIEYQVENETKDAIEEFLKMTCEEFNSDIVGFGQRAKMNFLTYNDFEKYDWYSHYEKSEFNVEVEFNLERVGFIDLSKKDNRQ